MQGVLRECTAVDYWFCYSVHALLCEWKCIQGLHTKKRIFMEETKKSSLYSVDGWPAIICSIIGLSVANFWLTSHKLMPTSSPIYGIGQMILVLVAYVVLSLIISVACFWIFVRIAKRLRTQWCTNNPTNKDLVFPGPFFVIGWGYHPFDKERCNTNDLYEILTYQYEYI